jgi:hypothetical protein
MEANGKSILENSLFTISTESGDGRQSDVKRELSRVFHAISGANGRFKTGKIMDVGAKGIDVYNTILDGMDVPTRLGKTRRSAATFEMPRGADVIYAARRERRPYEFLDDFRFSRHRYGRDGKVAAEFPFLRGQVEFRPIHGEIPAQGSAAISSHAAEDGGHGALRDTFSFVDGRTIANGI